MPDLPDWSQSVSIDAASVTIPVSGSVSITSGSVTIANASIAVINATGTKITSARPPKELGVVINNPNPNTTTFTLDTDVQALVVVLYGDTLPRFTHLKVAWHPTGNAAPWVPLELFQFNQQVYAIPIIPQTRDGSSNLVNQVDVTLQGVGLGANGVEIIELFESAPLWLEVFPLPQIEPNQLPMFVDPGQIPKLTGTSVAFALIAAVANVQISLFEIALQYAIYGAAHSTPGFVIGHSAALPTQGGGGPTQPQTLIKRISADASLYTYLFHGAQLPRGDGLWVWNIDVGDVLEVGATINYSLG